MKTLRIHYLQHVQFEGLGCIEDWIRIKDHHLSSTRFYEGEFVPEILDFDWLIVMGGPMGVYDDEKYNWINQEKEFIRKTIQAGKTVLGICLGSQLIASALGAKVYPNPEKEIGWFPVLPIQNNLADKFFGEQSGSFPVLHWHGDTFDLPENAVRIASGEACLNQAFVYQGKVVGLQFHFELTESSLERMITFCGEELVSGKYIQSEEVIWSSKHLIKEVNKQMFHLLDVLEATTLL